MTTHDLQTRRSSGRRLIFAGIGLLVLAAIIYFVFSNTLSATENETSTIAEITALVGAIAGLITALAGLIKVIKAEGGAAE